jgi:hypothetical protein
MGLLPSRVEAAERLAERAGEYFNHRHPLHEDIDGQLEIWTWDEAARGPVARRVPVDDARWMLAARYAREAYAVRPEVESVRLVYLATMLEEASFAAGLGNPLPSEKGSPAATAAAFGPNVLESVLALAVKDGHPAAAAAAARLLGKVGSADQLLYRSALPGPLVEATRNPDRRLRLAAAEAILRLKPTRPFAGSSQVTQALAYLINTSGRPWWPIRRARTLVGSAVSSRRWATRSIRPRRAARWSAWRSTVPITSWPWWPRRYSSRASTS